MIQRLVQMEKTEHEDMRMYHCRGILTSKPRESSWHIVETTTEQHLGPDGNIQTVTQPILPNLENPLMQTLMEIPGVASVDIYRHRLLIHKSPLYSWGDPDQINDSILRLLSSFSWPIEKFTFQKEGETK